MQLAVTGGVSHSEGYSMGDEQMGCSLLRVGVLPKQTDWEVDEGVEENGRHWTTYSRRVKKIAEQLI